MFSDPMDYLPEGTPKSLKKLVVVVPENEGEFWDNDKETFVFKPSSRYYIRDSWGNYVYFKTRSRAKATEISNKIYGNGFFTVKEVVNASVH